MTFGCQIWGQSRSTHGNKIFKLQNRAMRIINFETHDAKPDPLYKRNNILKLDHFIKLQNCLLIHDYMNRTLPSCFQDYYFKQNYMNYNVQTRNSSLGCLFIPSKNTTTYGLNSISQQAIYNWNKATKTYQNDLTSYSRLQLKGKLTEHFIENN